MCCVRSCPREHRVCFCVGAGLVEQSTDDKSWKSSLHLRTPGDWENQAAVCHDRHSPWSLARCIQNPVTLFAILSPGFEVVDAVAVRPVGLWLLGIAQDCAVLCLWIFTLCRVGAPSCHLQEPGASSCFVPGRIWGGRNSPGFDYWKYKIDFEKTLPPPV